MTVEKKYELTNDHITLPDESRVYRIRALITFGCGDNLVRAGDYGGYILKESNLSHFGACWVSGNAIVCGNAKVVEDAVVDGDVMIGGHTVVGARVGTMCDGGEFAPVAPEAKTPSKGYAPRMFRRDSSKPETGFRK
ncbi:hypothetical protein [Singulisphaera sp. PoT]|uniref:hypothetical protein n=1 Tax=Singulisphaera sp. PoT TaxID=3411797 RepID=UPI003BF4608B